MVGRLNYSNLSDSTFSEPQAGIFGNTASKFDRHNSDCCSSQYYELGVSDRLYGYSLGEWWTPHGGVPMQGIWRAGRTNYPTHIYNSSRLYVLIILKL